MSAADVRQSAFSKHENSRILLYRTLPAISPITTHYELHETIQSSASYRPYKSRPGRAAAYIPCWARNFLALIASHSPGFLRGFERLITRSTKVDLRDSVDS